MNKQQRIRLLILGLLLTGIIILHYLHINEGPSYPSAHAMCPLGGLENLWNWLQGQAPLQKLFSGTMTLFFLSIIFAFIFGKAFCGTICPFGALQEFTGKLRRSKITVPNNIDISLRKFKYVILLLVTALAWTTSSLWIAPYDPYTAFAHIWSGQEVIEENFWGLILLIIILAASPFISRPFCRYLCPAGALYGWIAKISLFKISHTPCTKCTKCARSCPMAIKIYEEEQQRSAECIACGQCVASCPSAQQHLKLTIGGHPIKQLTFTILSVMVFFGSLWGLDKAGLYQITVPTTASIAQSKNYLKAADLRGSMTIEDAAAYMGIDLAMFYKKFAIPEQVPPQTRLKEIRNIVPDYNFEKIKNNAD